jgi:hypothetical protein
MLRRPAVGDAHASLFSRARAPTTTVAIAIRFSVYKIICVLYDNNDFARFYVLETVARVPYFAYLSVMHFRETFGSRTPGDSERMRTHYAEADNELHHLLIMESLGGNSSVIDRTLAQSMAFGYYWCVRCEPVRLDAHTRTRARRLDRAGASCR